MLGNRLRKRHDQLRKWAARAGIEAFRLYERDIPEFPLVVDWYAGDVVAWLQPRTRDDTPEKAAEHRARCVQEIREGLELEKGRLFLKTRRRQRHRREGATDDELAGQYERTGEANAVRVIAEQGLKFEVNLSDYLDTGLFLDHRVTRDLVRQRAQGKRVLNLFAYTGSFTCYALAGGAAATTTVDLSNTYQAWTERNMRLNGFEPSRDHRLIAADCVEWIAREQYDIVVCDPPTFSNSKRMKADSFAIDRDYPDLLRWIARFVAPGGEVFFSTNSRSFEFDMAHVPAGFGAHEISHRSVPEDFRNRRIHRCWRLAEGWIPRSRGRADRSEDKDGGVSDTLGA